MKNILFGLAALLLSSNFAQASVVSEITRVSDLPSDTLNCALVFANAGTMARLVLSDGGEQNGTKYLVGDLTFYKDNQEIRRLEKLDVLIDRDATTIEAGYLLLNGLEATPSTFLRMRMATNLGNGLGNAYTGAIATEFPITEFARSNAGCAFLDK